MKEIGIIKNENSELAAELVGLCSGKGLKVSSAESCTGGMISAYITSVPGASAVLDGSLVSYANEVKIKTLGVDPVIIRQKGAVSAECVAAMADGIVKLFGADIGIAVSGIAGPGGGSDEKPVGTVFVCVKLSDAYDVKRCLFEGDRESVREQTARSALAAAIEMIKGYYT